MYDEFEAMALEYSWNKLFEVEGYIIQIGCNDGSATLYLANLIYPEYVYAIDQWNDKTAFDNVVSPLDNVEAYNMTWQKFFRSWIGDVKFLHLVNPLDYQETLNLLKLAKSIMAPGGVILGENFDQENVHRAASEILGPHITHNRNPLAFEWTNK